MIKQLIRNRMALATLSRTELKLTVTQTKLGGLWWILDPLIMMSIYYFIVVIIFQRGGPGYHLFVLVGIVSWGTFSRSIMSVMSSISGNRSLLANTSIPLEVFTCSPLGGQAFLATVGYAVILSWVMLNSLLLDDYGQLNLLVLITNVSTVFQIIPLLFLVLLYAYSLGIFFAVATVFVPDLRKVVAYVLRGGFFLTPILYTPERVLGADGIPEIFKNIYLLNPIGWCITSLRQVILSFEVINVQWYFTFLFGGIIVLQSALFLLNTTRKIVCKYI